MFILLAVPSLHPCVAILPFTLVAQKPTGIPRVLRTWGHNLKKRRLELGLLQREVAERLGVNRSTITNWEVGRTAPRLQLLPKIHAFLGYEPGDGPSEGLAERLLHYGKSRGLTQKALAREIGIDPGTLSGVERGTAGNYGATLRKIEAFLARAAKAKEKERDSP